MLRVIVVGLGPIGVSCAHAVRAKKDMQLVGIVDADPAKLGAGLKDLAQQPERGTPPDDPLRVKASIAEAAASGADVVLLTTTSRFDVAAQTIRECLRLGLAVVSSCEQMAWPWYQHAAVADQIDAAARAAKLAVLGTGVNPGFVMDYLPIVLAGVVRRVTSVRCVRRLDAGMRRKALQKKVGATMTVAEFRRLAAENALGHVGIAESTAMIAAGLGRRVKSGSVAVTLEPVIADKPLESGLGLIQPGQVTGMRNTAKWQGEDLSIELDLTMAVGVTEAMDQISLEGPVPLKLQIPGSVPGDSATVAILVNHARRIREMPPGLRTMLDMPPVGCRG